MGLKVQLITAPSKEPVSVSEIKNQLRIEDTDEDSLIEGLIVAAREIAEQILRKALITQTWKLYLDDFPSHDCIKLPFPKLQSVSWIKYYDENNTLTTWASSNYEVDAVDVPGRIVLAQSASWPSVYDRINPVEIQFVCGYGDDAVDVPAAIRLAIKHIVAHWFEHREPFVAGLAVNEVPVTFRRILMPYRFLEVK